MDVKQALRLLPEDELIEHVCEENQQGPGAVRRHVKQAYGRMTRCNE